MSLYFYIEQKELKFLSVFVFLLFLFIYIYILCFRCFYSCLEEKEKDFVLILLALGIWYGDYLCKNDGV